MDYSRTLQLQLPSTDGQSPLAFNCQWRPNEPFEAAFGLRTIDLLATTTSNVLLAPGQATTLQEKTPFSTFLAEAALANPGQISFAIKLVVPAASGFVMRSDLLDFRMFRCPRVCQTASFVQPRQQVAAYVVDDARDGGEQLRLAMDVAIGAVLVEPATATRAPVSLETMAELESEMRNRLSINFFSESPIPERRAITIAPFTDILSFVGLKAMGFQLVVLDRPGSWMEDDNGPHAHLRERFVPFDTNVDAEFPKRLKQIAIQFRVDGIFARPEPMLAFVAEVCRDLGLPTCPPETIRRGIDKHYQRQLHDEDRSSFRVSGVEHLQRYLDESPARMPEFPAVVKPTMGYGSQCVTKVSTAQELFQAVAKVKDHVVGHEGTKVITPDALIEPYVGGPEIDANLVLWDGELLFCEISDDFPSLADRDDATAADDFQETMFVFPSKLPRDEQDLLRTYLHQSILRLGFSSGVFHVEARVRDSSMHYVEQPGSGGVVDLEPLPSPPSKPPSVFLLEVNVRPPGYVGLMTAGYTYGIDYYALWALKAIGDETRFRALSQPYLNGPQHHAALVVIQPERGGVVVSEDPGVELQRRMPELMERIPLYRELFVKGDVVPEPDGPNMWFISANMVVSRHGREDLLQTVEAVRREWKHEIVQVE
ncbi:hypothetical protein AK830_g4870 [Neonectria ditissima]|uniref:ATP-grasp domain-containing protein n=1 Tax=Neonectria ditissima TaxID=78410 RepID=A0A0N8H7G2_9HYPO|nr:hypothetical protein AK830_g4870 [Neonectria ditissima]